MYFGSENMIVVITGPTGVGKTKLSVELAKRIHAEIINADSMQVYKGLDIATAKIKEEEKEGIVHHLFDIKEASEMYTIYDYQKDARRTIADILSCGKNVIFVGGSGLYIKAALYDYQFQEEKEKRSYEEQSNEEIKARIEKVMPCPIHVNNRKRLVRMLNKIENSAMTLEKKDKKKLYDFVTIGLTTSREILYQKINDRVDHMMEEGLEQEVKTFYDQNLRSKAILTGIGYKEFYEYFDHKITKEEAIAKIKKNSRRYAKRQYTFLNHQMDVHWINTNYEDFKQTIEEAYRYVKKVYKF